MRHGQESPVKNCPMNVRERYKLLHGPYAPPRCRVGRKLFCEIRGWVAVAGMSGGGIPWPMCRVGRHGRARAFILCRDLAKAVRHESNQAVCCWFGVTPQTVKVWRKALDVPPNNEGTQRLNRDWMPWRLTEEERRKAIAAMSSPQANAKKSAAKIGKPRPPHVIEALRQANLRRQFSDEHRQKLSAAQRARGAWPPSAGRPWTAEEDAFFGTMNDLEVAARIGRSRVAVRERRTKLGIPIVPMRRRKHRTRRRGGAERQ